MIAGYVIWDVNPEILPSLFESLPVHPRWYGLLFALGFVTGYNIVRKYLRNEGFDEGLMDSLLVYVMVGTVLGARLGHVFFYDWEYYQHHLGEILMVWKGGLASHGAAIGVPFSVWLWSKKVSKQSFLWGMDKVVVTVALAAVFIRTGNLMNSEIIGKPTESSYGFVFTQSTSSFLKEYGGFVEDVEVIKPQEPGTPVDFKITYSRKIKDTAQVAYVMDKAEQVIATKEYMSEHVEVNRYQNPVLLEGSPGNWTGTMRVEGIPRHPTQLYEAGFYLCIFLIIYMLYPKIHKREGAIFGIFLIGIFGWRIFVETFKENQVAFEDDMSLNMGQWLSIPLVLAGVYLLLKALRSVPGE